MVAKKKAANRKVPQKKAPTPKGPIGGKGKGLNPKIPPPPPEAKPIPPQPKGHVIAINLTTDSTGVNCYNSYNVSDPSMGIDMVIAAVEVCLAVVKHTKATIGESQRKIQQRAAAMTAAQAPTPPRTQR